MVSTRLGIALFLPSCSRSLTRASETGSPSVSWTRITARAAALSTTSTPPVGPAAWAVTQDSRPERRAEAIGVPSSLIPITSKVPSSAVTFVGWRMPTGASGLVAPAHTSAPATGSPRASTTRPVTVRPTSRSSSPTDCSSWVIVKVGMIVATKPALSTPPHTVVKGTPSSRNVPSSSVMVVGIGRRPMLAMRKSGTCTPRASAPSAPATMHFSLRSRMPVPCSAISGIAAIRTRAPGTGSPSSSKTVPVTVPQRGSTMSPTSVRAPGSSPCSMIRMAERPPPPSMAKACSPLKFAPSMRKRPSASVRDSPAVRPSCPIAVNSGSSRIPRSPSRSSTRIATTGVPSSSTIRPVTPARSAAQG